MGRVNDQGYIERKVAGRSGKWRKTSWRNWWLVKHDGKSRRLTKGNLYIGYITLPTHLTGKRVRFKIEVIE